MISKHRVLVALAFVAVLCGGLSQYFYPFSEQAPTDLAVVFLGTFLLFAWYRLDSDQRAYKRTVGLNVAVVALAGIAFPYYLFRTRGFKSGLLATVLFFLAILAFGLLFGLGGLGAYALQP